MVLRDEYTNLTKAMLTTDKVNYYNKLKNITIKLMR